MRVVGKYSFNGGKEVVETDYAAELEEIYKALAPVNADQYRTKESKEKTMAGKMLYSPGELNRSLGEMISHPCKRRSVVVQIAPYEKASPTSTGELSVRQS